GGLRVREPAGARDDDPGPPLRETGPERGGQRRRPRLARHAAVRRRGNRHAGHHPHQGRDPGGPAALARDRRRDGRAADRQRPRRLVPPRANRAHDEHLHGRRQGGRQLRGPDRRREARGLRLRRVRRPDDARELLVHGGLRSHDPRRPGGGAGEGRRAGGEFVPDARPHRSHRRRLPLEPDGRRVWQGRPVSPPRHRRGTARPHRGGAGGRRRGGFGEAGGAVIAQLIEAAGRRADGGADALWRRVERTTVAFEWGRLKSAATTEEAGANLRVRHRGQVGVAGTTATAARPDVLVARALASATLGEELELVFPAPGPLPPVTTCFDRAANASLDDLIGIGRSLLARLEREGCRVNVAIERETTATRVANSAGASGEYRGTAFGVSADVWRIAGDDVLVGSDAREGADVPSDEAL